MIEPAEKLTGAQTPELLARLEEFPKRFPNVDFKIVNELSNVAASYFPDDYFDWVYIDGLHTYTGVSSDVSTFWMKVKPGGLFSGHDFSMSRAHAKSDPWNTLAPWSGMREGREKAGFPGSYKAVVMHAKKHALQIFYTLEGRSGAQMWDAHDTGGLFRNNPSWFMFKPAPKLEGQPLEIEYGYNTTGDLRVFSALDLI
eukprot:CAMPEP_0197598030 /NCGR_PEP_ID=MMETSP1326-20131121/28497_1 /TAXON_ID=1155430 /ORGANISM="Genus nov. species nov., Strain RCC2288" /LENGTH=198 /DNA_ID=CAMNT_0043164783 /DNA_START=353 /DNA_END=949 /DNA_ORIENTATION=-